jgi:hypothetical protein
LGAAATHLQANIPLRQIAAHNRLHRTVGCPRVIQVLLQIRPSVSTTERDYTRALQTVWDTPLPVSGLLKLNI